MPTVISDIRGVNPAVTAFFAASVANFVFPVIHHGQAVSDLFGIRASGGTPLAGALFGGLQTMLSFKEQRKMTLVATDGMLDTPASANSVMEVPLNLSFEGLSLACGMNT